MLEVTNIASVIIDFPDNQKIFERLFGLDGSEITPNWFEETMEHLSSFIEEFHDSTDEEQMFLRQQCMIAKSIIAFAKNSGGEPYFVCQVDDTLELQFDFEETYSEYLFMSNIHDYVQNSTGLQL